MPLLARMLAAPLTVDIRLGAICSLGALLAAHEDAALAPRSAGLALARRSALRGG